MRHFATYVLLSAIAGAVGCAKSAPPPPRAEIPPPGMGRERVVDVQRPVEQTTYPHQERLYDDVPIMNERPPEQKAFVEAYNDVGRPKLTLFVNRTLDGHLLPVTDNDPLVTVDHRRRASSGVTVERRTTDDRRGYYRDDRTESVDRFESTGPGEYRETTEVYLRPGQYDEVLAKQIDYQAIETIMTDWLSADGQVVIMSPTVVRQRLTDQQVAELEAGRPQVMREIAQQLDTDILVQVQARPTRQTERGLDVRMVVEAFNVMDGQSIARAVVDMPAPLEKTTINRYTRFLARKLMDGMIGTWSAPPPAVRGQPANGAPEPAAPRQPAPNAAPDIEPSQPAVPQESGTEPAAR